MLTYQEDNYSDERTSGKISQGNNIIIIGYGGKSTEVKKMSAIYISFHTRNYLSSPHSNGFYRRLSSSRGQFNISQLTILHYRKKEKTNDCLWDRSHPSFRIDAHVYFLFFCKRRHRSSVLAVTGRRLRSISTVRGESYDGNREDTSAAIGTPKEVVRDHSFSLPFLFAG